MQQREEEKNKRNNKATTNLATQDLEDFLTPSAKSGGQSQPTAGKNYCTLWGRRETNREMITGIKKLGHILTSETPQQGYFMTIPQGTFMRRWVLTQVKFKMILRY